MWLAHNRGCASRHRLLYSSPMALLFSEYICTGPDADGKITLKINPHFLHNTPRAVISTLRRAAEHIEREPWLTTRAVRVFLIDACANPACGHSVSDHVTKTEAEREYPLACYLCDCLCFKEPKPE